MRADRLFRPNPSLQPFTGGGFVREDRVFENVRGHDQASFLLRILVDRV